MNRELKDIFLNNGVHILDLSNWDLYFEKNNYEKGVVSKYYQRKDTIGTKKVITIGVFYKRGSSSEINYVAWGYRGEIDCSFNARVKDNRIIEKVISGCPIEEYKEEGYLSVTYLPIYFYLSITLSLAAIFTLFLYGKDLMEFMRLYMGVFFLLFGTLKLVNIQKFAASFSSYDLIAKKYPGYGYSYVFLELLAGLLFLLNIQMSFANLLTVIIILPTTVGIIRSVMKDERLNCACLGGFFNIPIGPITIMENIVMILMAFYMLF